MATFLELKTDVNEIASRTVPDYTYKALTAELNARLRVVEMEATTDISTVVSTEKYNLPSNYLETINLFAFGGGISTRIPIMLTNEGMTSGSLSLSGVPVEAVIVKDLIGFNPIPDNVYTIRLRYIASLANLSGDSDTNDVLDGFYNIYLYGALKHWTALTRNMERMQHWSGLFEEAVAQAEAATARARYGVESASVMPPQRGAA